MVVSLGVPIFRVFTANQNGSDPLFVKPRISFLFQN